MKYYGYLQSAPSFCNDEPLTTQTRNKEKLASITIESGAHGLELASHGICTIRGRYKKEIIEIENYSHTFENKSSAPPPNPPAGLVEAVVEETGAALSQPPKSSSVATVGAGLGDGTPQPPGEMSFAVIVSGTFIISAVEGAAGATGSGSGLDHALLPPPHGSMLDGSMLAVTAGVDAEGEIAGLGAGAGDGFRLKADFISS